MMNLILFAGWLAFFILADVKRDVLYAVTAVLTTGIMMAQAGFVSMKLLGVDSFTLASLMFLISAYLLIRVLLTNGKDVERNNKTMFD